MSAARISRTFHSPRPVDLPLTLRPLQRAGSADPTIRFESEGVWRATRTPEGPATAHLSAQRDTVTVEAWGPGADWAAEHAPTLLGALDDDADFIAHHPLVAELYRRHPGLRIPRTEAVFEAVIPTVLEQKVVGLRARQAYRQLLRRFGEAAPGPAGLIVPPSATALAGAPYWVFHGFGVERRRAETIRRAAVHAGRLEEAARMDLASARRRLLAIAGLGQWSAAKVALVALGDADAVPIGDYHLPHLVCWALTGRVRGTDEQMLELLEPYRGHRGRVVRLLMASGISAPRFGPRLAVHAIERI